MSSQQPSNSQQDQPPPTAEEAALTQTLASDRPTIDSAIKSYISLVLSRNMTASATDAAKVNSSAAHNALLGIVNASNPSSSITSSTGALPPSTATSTPSSSSTRTSVQQNVLSFARVLLGSMNSYEFPIHQTVLSEMSSKPGMTPEKQQELIELSVVARIWNGLIASNPKQKPSRFLGRRSLQHVWNNLELESKFKENMVSKDDSVLLSQQLQWLQEFETLLFQNNEQQDQEEEDIDDDSQLLWGADGGQNELLKRQTRRNQAAALRRRNNDSNDEDNNNNNDADTITITGIPKIEEITEEMKESNMSSS